MTQRIVKRSFSLSFNSLLEMPDGFTTSRKDGIAGVFQFSIGDAISIRQTKEYVRQYAEVSILYWRCVDVLRRRLRNVAVHVSILYWRCDAL